MADLADPAQSPSVHDDAIATGNGNGAPGGENRGVKRPRVSAAADDDDDDDDKPGRERRKIDIKFIQDKSRRHITFSKRKAGIMKKVTITFLPSNPLTSLGCRVQRRACVGRWIGILLPDPRLIYDGAIRPMNSPF